MRFLAWLERLFSPGWGWCGRCHRPWNHVTPHSTPYYSTMAMTCSMFPLCLGCWHELETAEKRLPYYLELLARWRTTTPGYGPSDEAMTLILKQEEDRWSWLETN